MIVFHIEIQQQFLHITYISVCYCMWQRLCVSVCVCVCLCLYQSLYAWVKNAKIMVQGAYCDISQWQNYWNNMILFDTQYSHFILSILWLKTRALDYVWRDAALIQAEHCEIERAINSNWKIPPNILYDHDLNEHKKTEVVPLAVTEHFNIKYNLLQDWCIAFYIVQTASFFMITQNRLTLKTAKEGNDISCQPLFILPSWGWMRCGNLNEEPLWIMTIHVKQAPL